MHKNIVQPRYRGMEDEHARATKTTLIFETILMYICMMTMMMNMTMLMEMTMLMDMTMREMTMMDRARVLWGDHLAAASPPNCCRVAPCFLFYLSFFSFFLVFLFFFPCLIFSFLVFLLGRAFSLSFFLGGGGRQSFLFSFFFWEGWGAGFFTFLFGAMFLYFPFFKLIFFFRKCPLEKLQLLAMSTSISPCL